MSRFFGVIVLAFGLVFLAAPASLQAQHRGGFRGGPTAIFNARPPVARPGPAFVGRPVAPFVNRSEEHTSELQSRSDLVCRLLLEKKNQKMADYSGHLPRRLADV